MINESASVLSKKLPSLSPDLKKSENGKQSVIESAQSNRPFNEKIVYRTKRLPTLADKLNESAPPENLECSRCHSTISIKNEKRDLGTPRSRGSHTSFDRRSSVVDHFSSNINNYGRHSNMSRRSRTKDPKLNQSLDWNDLGEKIEDWFDGAKTPDQRIVYKFLNDLNKTEDEAVSESGKMVEKVQSLEDILDNLKQYRGKLNDQNTKKRDVLPFIGGKRTPKSNYMSNLFESSTWRVMRHIKSADIRNKYPLPKANPDEHFRNSTVFYVANRPPKSTFLLHPDWV